MFRGHIIFKYESGKKLLECLQLHSVKENIQMSF